MTRRLLLAALFVAHATALRPLRPPRSTEKGAPGVDAQLTQPLPGSPFKNVVLLVQGVHADKIGWIEKLYDPIFADVLTVQWLWKREIEEVPGQVVLSKANAKAGPAEQDKLASLRRNERLHNLRPRIVCEMTARIFYQAMCLPTIVKILSMRNPHSDGLMTFHSDFWLRPSSLLRRGWDLASIWQLKGGLKTAADIAAPYCISGSGRIANDTNWHWRGNKDQPRAVAAMEKFRNLTGNTDNTVCVGWVDAFYLPRAAWDMFFVYSWHAFFELNHEIAIPTTFRILNRYHGVPLHAEDRCWGGCCTDPADVAEVLAAPCGHKMELQNATVRAAWAKVMQEEAGLFER